MFGFFLGCFIGASAVAIIMAIHHGRHEWKHDTCARCGRAFGDWGPPAEPPHGFL